MKILSTAIQDATKECERNGVHVIEISEGWSKVRQFVHMATPLSPNLRTHLAADPRLRAWRTSATPHDKAEEGFTDDLEQVAITFPA